MSRLMLMSDLHLGHKNICKYRPNFSSEEEHSNTIYENLATNIGKRDTLWLLGDVAFTFEWLEKIKQIKCKRKVLIVGNHDLERGITMKHLVDVYDDVFAVLSHRNYWFQHTPMHPQEMRSRLGNIHGHLHGSIIDDPRYFNVCVEHTNWKPISFAEVIQR